MPLNKNVTICIPTYNAESTLAESLESILAQTYGNLHLIVVDNASTDKTCELVEKYMALDDRVSLNRNHVNVGGEGNFTRCLNLAAGDYTAIFHADDVYEPDMVLRQVELLETRPGSGMVFSNASLIDDKGHIYGEHILPPELFQTYHGHLDLKAALGLLVRDGNFFICPSAMARTHIYQQLKQWSRYNFGSSSDLDVWLRVLQNHEVTVLPEKLMRYRTSPESFTWHYAFLRTERSDFYTVMDEYVYNINPDLVSRQGNIDYRFKNFKEDVGRAFNALMKNERGLCRTLAQHALKYFDSLEYLIRYRWLKFLLITSALWLLSFLPLPKSLIEFLTRIRYQRSTQ